MKIVMLAAANSIHVIRWANAFSDRGNEVHLASQHRPAAGLNNSVHLHQLRHWAGLGYLLNGLSLKRIIDRVQPDVVNAHYASGYGTLARFVRSVPLVLNVWGSDVYEFPETSPLHKGLLVHNLKHADLLVSTSRTMADRTRSLADGLPPIEVVPFGIDTDLFLPKNGPREERTVIGTVKTLAPKYGIDILIRAFALIQKEQFGKRVILRIVGGGPQREQLIALAGELGVGDSVEFVGQVPHQSVPDELRKLDIYIALSRADSESFGVAILEASACGIPVIVSDAGGLPEVVIDGSTGHVVPKEDHKAAAEKIRMLLASDTYGMKLGVAGRDHVKKNYSWDKCVDRMIELLTEAQFTRQQ